MTDPLIPAPAKLRLSSPAAVLEAVPYLLGFHPADSVVILALRGRRRRVGLTMRLDRAALHGADAASVAADTARLVRRDGGTEALLVGYSGDAGTELARQIHATLESAFAVADIAVCESLHVAHGRWWSLLCPDVRCCPPEGVRLADPDPESEIALVGAVGGLSPLPSRAALANSLNPAGAEELAAVQHALESALDQRAARLASGAADARNAERVSTLRRAQAAARACEDGPIQIPAADLAALLAGLTDVGARDLCLEWSGRARASEAALRLWTHLSRHAPRPYDAVPLSLLAWCAYRAGNGALAGLAVERARRSDPTYTLAALLEEALDRCVPPSVIAAAEAGIRPSGLRGSGVPRAGRSAKPIASGP